MTRLGADATSETIAELQALGVTFVSRYVSDFPGKNLTLAEAQRLTDAGIDLVTNWENDVDDWVGGYDQGVAYAERAYAQHRACGGRTDELLPYWGIYFSVDEKVDPNDSTVHAYFRGINHVLTPRHTGCYGQTSLLRALKAAGLIGCGDRGGTWRSMSTFGLPEGLGNPGEFDVEQTGQYSEKYDRDVANSAHFGQWRVGQQGVNMAALDTSDPDWQALIWRAKAVVDLDQTVANGPTKGEPNALAARLAALQNAVAAVPGQAVDYAQLAAALDYDRLGQAIAQHLHLTAD